MATVTGTETPTLLPRRVQLFQDNQGKPLQIHVKTCHLIQDAHIDQQRMVFPKRTTNIQDSGSKSTQLSPLQTKHSSQPKQCEKPG